MPIREYKGSLPALAALTPIHAHLAVQYQMCVMTQLPHILLLTATLWQGTPTSLWKCVFDLTRRSLRHLQLKSQALLVSKDETESGNAFRGRYPN